MRINHNIQALNAYRNLSNNSIGMSKHLERLSSGLRINRAADDAAGLAISEKMRSQIKGLEMAERNTLDGISLIQTAEGALGTTHAILQRMRELSVQAANGTLADQDRVALQSEMDQLTLEIDRIARTTQFNSKPLLRGAAEGRPFTSIQAAEVNYISNGTWGGVVTANPSEPAAAQLDLDYDFGNQNAATVNGQTFTINGKTYQLETDPAAVVTNGNIAVYVDTWTDPAGNDANVIGNINDTLTQLTAAINANDPAFNTSLFTQTPAADDTGAVAGTLGNSGSLVLRTADKLTQVEAANMAVGTNAVGASFSEEGTTNVATTMIAPTDSVTSKSVVLSFTEVPKEGDFLTIDNVTITFGTSSTVPAPTINIENKDVYSILAEIDTALANATVAGDAPALISHSVLGNSLVLSTDKIDDGGSNGLDIAIHDDDFALIAGTSLKVNMQIGANASENMDVTIGIMDAASLGLARQANHSTPITTAGVDAVAGIDISSSATAAQAAIDILDNAIKSVSEERSRLGAYQNRMEHTLNNLGIAGENLTSAESRIRDADMAMEMSNFTKTNIINQAATAMLSQANQLPQGILQLLK